ncbi:hypothetical protein FQN57_000848 [Myotisia sp. PD_48]|nr:hypothetical protein FQN57_000848 [Myotisia sp. PD_48]
MFRSTKASNANSLSHHQYQNLKTTPCISIEYQRNGKDSGSEAKAISLTFNLCRRFGEFGYAIYMQPTLNNELLVSSSMAFSPLREDNSYGVGDNRTAAHAAWHAPKLTLQAMIVAGADAPNVAPQVKPAAA